MPGPTVITDTQVAGLLKNVYSDVRRDMFPKSTPFIAQLQKGSAGGPRNLRWGGNGVLFNAKMTRATGMSASASGYLPPDAPATEAQGTIGIKRFYVTRELDGLAIQGTQSAEAAYQSIARKALDEIQDAIKLGMQEMAHGDGRGIKAIVSTNAATNNLVVTSPYGLASSGEGGLLLDVGMYIAVIATDGVTVKGRSYINTLTVSGDNATLNLTTALSSNSATGDYVVAATTSDTSYNNYLEGIQKLLNYDGSTFASVHGLTSATYSRWDATRFTANTDTDSLAPTENDLWKLFTKIAGRSGQSPFEKPGEFIMIGTPGLLQALANSLIGTRQRAVDMQLKGGFTGVNICGLPYIADPWCPAGTIYVLHVPSLTWVDSKDWGAVEFQDSNVWRPISGRDAYQTSFGSYMNLGVLQRNAHGLIKGYTDTARFSHVM